MHVMVVFTSQIGRQSFHELHRMSRSKLMNVKILYKHCFSTQSLTASLGDRLKREEEVLSRLEENVLEPLTRRSIKSIGMLRGVNVHGDGRVLVELDSIVPGYPAEDEVASMCKEAVMNLDWVSEIETSVLTNKRSMQPISSTLNGIGHVIGVSSCKGGVGKSTVSVLLARALAKKGLKVGLLDADVYGPSIPSLVEVMDESVRRDPNKPDCILPLEDLNGIKVLSFGHVNPRAGVAGAGGQGAAVMRGPVVSRVINQLLHKTQWGDLDYLLIDMPPGTGDIQITLSQSAVLSGAVIVTTPHMLAVTDVIKGIEMFNDMKVPTLAIVENMSYFQCNRGTTYYPFGPSGHEELIKKFKNLRGNKLNEDNGVLLSDLENCNFHRIPLSRGNEKTIDITSDKDSNLPFMKESETESNVFDEISNGLVEELFVRTVDAVSLPLLSIKENSIIMRFFSTDEATQFSIPMRELRRRDPKSGEILSYADMTDNFNERVLSIDLKGKYGASFEWSDGQYADIFSYDVLVKIAKARSE